MTIPHIGDVYIAPQKSLSAQGSHKAAENLQKPSFQEMVKNDRQQMYKLMGAAMESASSTMMLKEGDPGDTMTQLIDMTVRMQDMDARQKEGQTLGDIAEAIKSNRQLTESLLALEWTGNETQVKSNSFEWKGESDTDKLRFSYDLVPPLGAHLQNASLLITDKEGRVLHVEPLDASRQGNNLDYTWEGTIFVSDAERNLQPERLKKGSYNVHIAAESSKGEAVPVPIYMNRTITSAILGAGDGAEGPRLSTGDQTFGLNDIHHFTRA